MGLFPSGTIPFGLLAVQLLRRAPSPAVKMIACTICGQREEFMILMIRQKYILAGPLRLMDDIWDAIIIGGGPAGSTVARYAAEGGAKVLVIDRRKKIGTRE